MIVGLGLDLVELERISEIDQRNGKAFERRIARPGEVRPRRGAARVQHLGGLFAAKEAALKALGTGWAQGLSLRQVEVRHRPDGGPEIELHGAAAERAERLGVETIHVTITHERTHAAAVVVLEGRGAAGGEETPPQ